MALRQDLRSQTAFMDEPLQNPRKSHFRQVIARFAQAHATNSNLADAEFPADQIVQPNSTSHYVSARIQRGKWKTRLCCECLKVFLLDQRKFEIRFLRRGRESANARGIPVPF